jgi:hypothetical protein
MPTSYRARRGALKGWLPGKIRERGLGVPGWLTGTEQ